MFFRTFSTGSRPWLRTVAPLGGFGSQDGTLNRYGGWPPPGAVPPGPTTCYLRGLILVRHLRSEELVLAWVAFCLQFICPFKGAVRQGRVRSAAAARRTVIADPRRQKWSAVGDSNSRPLACRAAPTKMPETALEAVLSRLRPSRAQTGVLHSCHLCRVFHQFAIWRYHGLFCLKDLGAGHCGQFRAQRQGTPIAIKCYPADFVQRPHRGPMIPKR